jgi:antitoxin VapB
MSEYQLTALMSGAAEARGVRAQVLLVATDERIFRYRHPLPTAKAMQRYAMLVFCGRQHGLVCSVTRLVHFGPLPDELQHKSQAVAEVDASMIAATRPGRSLGEVFELTRQAYARVGYPDEWQLHHQGGPAGYEPREFLATASVDVPVGLGQAYAWNPSITGTKSEDTILVSPAGNQVLSLSPDWPAITVEVAGQSIARPAILVVE